MLSVVGIFSTTLQGKTKATTQNICVVRGLHKALLGEKALKMKKLYLENFMILLPQTVLFL